LAAGALVVLAVVQVTAAIQLLTGLPLLVAVLVGVGIPDTLRLLVGLVVVVVALSPCLELLEQQAGTAEVAVEIILGRNITFTAVGVVAAQELVAAINRLEQDMRMVDLVALAQLGLMGLLTLVVVEAVLL
jgi:hypothetical protein